MQLFFEYIGCKALFELEQTPPFVELLFLIVELDQEQVCHHR